MTKPFSKEEYAELKSRHQLPISPGVFHRFFATIDAYEKLVEEKDEALEIILHERDTLEKKDPVWVLDPAFDIVSSTLGLKLEDINV